MNKEKNPHPKTERNISHRHKLYRKNLKTSITLCRSTTPSRPHKLAHLWFPTALASGFALSTFLTCARDPSKVVWIRFTCIMNKFLTHHSSWLCHSRPASRAPGSVSAAAGLVGWATGGAGATGPGARGATGMLTICSLMNSFNLQIRRQWTLPWLYDHKSRKKMFLIHTQMLT